MFPNSPKSLLPIVASLFLLSVSHARADVAQVIPEFGDLERWAAFSLGGGSHFSYAVGNAFIDGDVGLAGNGKFLMAGNATVNGDVYYRSNGAILLFDNATVTGSIFNNQDALLDNGVNEALAASAHAAGLMPNRSDTTMTLGGNDALTIAGAPGETVVLDLKNFVLRGGSSLTLEGTATTTFIINVNKKFSLKGNSHVDLAGLQWNQVLFNVVGPGEKVSLGGNSTLQGILMANERRVELKGNATVSGEIIANRIKLRGSSRVLHPTIVSEGGFVSSIAEKAVREQEFSGSLLH
jgi:hypothetical protein